MEKISDPSPEHSQGSIDQDFSTRPISTFTETSLNSPTPIPSKPIEIYLGKAPTTSNSKSNFTSTSSTPTIAEKVATPTSSVEEPLSSKSTSSLLLNNSEAELHLKAGSDEQISLEIRVVNVQLSEVFVDTQESLHSTFSCQSLDPLPADKTPKKTTPLNSQSNFLVVNSKFLSNKELIDENDPIPRKRVKASDSNLIHKGETLTKSSSHDPITNSFTASNVPSSPDFTLTGIDNSIIDLTSGEHELNKRIKEIKQDLSIYYKSLLPDDVNDGDNKEVFIEANGSSDYLSLPTSKDLWDLSVETVPNFNILWIFLALITLEKENNKFGQYIHICFFHKPSFSLKKNHSFIYVFPPGLFTDDSFKKYIHENFEKSTWFQVFSHAIENQEFGLLIPIRYGFHWSLLFVQCSPIQQKFEVIVLDSKNQNLSSLKSSMDSLNKEFDLNLFLLNINHLKSVLFHDLSSNDTESNVSTSNSLTDEVELDSFNFIALTYQPDNESSSFHVGFSAKEICLGFLSHTGVTSWLEHQTSRTLNPDDIKKIRRDVFVKVEDFRIEKMKNVIKKRKVNNNKFLLKLDFLKYSQNFETYFKDTFREASAAALILRHVLLFYHELKRQKNDYGKTDINERVSVPDFDQCPYWQHVEDLKMYLVNFNYYLLFPNLSQLVIYKKNSEIKMWTNLVTKSLPIPFIDKMYFMVSSSKSTYFLDIHQQCIDLIDDKLLQTFVHNSYDPSHIKAVLELIPHAFSKSRLTKELNRYKKHFFPAKKTEDLIYESRIDDNDWLRYKKFSHRSSKLPGNNNANNNVRDNRTSEFPEKDLEENANDDTVLNQTSNSPEKDLEENANDDTVLNQTSKSPEKDLYNMDQQTTTKILKPENLLKEIKNYFSVNKNTMEDLKNPKESWYPTISESLNERFYRFTPELIKFVVDHRVVNSDLSSTGSDTANP